MLVIDPCCCRAADPDVSHNGNNGRDPTVVTITSYSHQAAPLYTQGPGPDSPHCAHILLFLFLFHFSTDHLLLLGAPGVSGWLGPSQECPAQVMYYGTRQGSSQAWSVPQGMRSSWLVVARQSTCSWSGICLGLALCHAFLSDPL